ANLRVQRSSRGDRISRRDRLLGICPLGHRSSAQAKDLDRASDPCAVRSLPRRKAPPLGYFAETPRAAITKDLVAESLLCGIGTRVRGVRSLPRLSREEAHAAGAGARRRNQGSGRTSYGEPLTGAHEGADSVASEGAGKRGPRWS